MSTLTPASHDGISAGTNVAARAMAMTIVTVRGPSIAIACTAMNTHITKASSWAIGTSMTNSASITKNRYVNRSGCSPQRARIAAR